MYLAFPLLLSTNQFSGLSFSLQEAAVNSFQESGAKQSVVGMYCSSTRYRYVLGQINKNSRSSSPPAFQNCYHSYFSSFFVLNAKSVCSHAVLIRGGSKEAGQMTGDRMLNVVFLPLVYILHLESVHITLL